jgi:sec-independent protein translocase protein TatB
MFNFSWSEIAVVVAVALVLIGPKDMPAAVRAITATIRKARRMASEFQGHVDEMMREANLGDVRDTLNEFRNLNVADALERTVDPDGSLRAGFDDTPGAGAADAAETEPVGELAVTEMQRPEDADAQPPAEAPAFIPPAAARTSAEAEPPAPLAAPAFIPPAFTPADGATRAAR